MLGVIASSQDSGSLGAGPSVYGYMHCTGLIITTRCGDNQPGSVARLPLMPVDLMRTWAMASVQLWWDSLSLSEIKLQFESKTTGQDKGPT